MKTKLKNKTCMIKKSEKKQSQKMSFFGQFDQKKWLQNLNKKKKKIEKVSKKNDQKSIKNKAQKRAKIFSQYYVGISFEGSKMSLFRAFFEAFQPLSRALKWGEIRPKTEVPSWKVRDKKSQKRLGKRAFFAQKPYNRPFTTNSFVASETSTEEFLQCSSLSALGQTPYLGLWKGFEAILKNPKSLGLRTQTSIWPKKRV